jgi:hypothetical protein
VSTLTSASLFTSPAPPPLRIEVGSAPALPLAEAELEAADPISTPAAPPLEIQLITARLAAWRDQLRPLDAVQEWVYGQVVAVSVRIEHCIEHRARIQQYEAERAAMLWDGDRRLEVETLGARLPRDPAKIRRQLESSRHGAEWLIERWDFLSKIHSGWSGPHRTEALNLLGIPRAQRPNPDVPEQANLPDPLPATPEAQVALAQSEIERLRRLKAVGLDALDTRERELACQGQPVHRSAALNQILRLEVRLRRDFQKALAELRKLQSEPPPTRWGKLGPEHAPKPPNGALASIGRPAGGPQFEITQLDDLDRPSPLLPHGMSDFLRSSRRQRRQRR